MSSWHEALADRTVVVGSSTPEEWLRRWIDEGAAVAAENARVAEPAQVGAPQRGIVPPAAPGAPVASPRFPLARFALLARPGVPGIVSEFLRHGQIVKVGISPEQIVGSTLLRAEWQTILERIVYRHRLERIVCSYPMLAEFGLEVAERLHVRFVSSSL